MLSRLHGLGPMGGTDLDPVLRNLGVTTIVGVGVSVNIAMLNFAMDAVNAGYQFVMPRDAVAGIPEDVRRVGARQHDLAARHAAHHRRRAGGLGRLTIGRPPDSGDRRSRRATGWNGRGAQPLIGWPSRPTTNHLSPTPWPLVCPGPESPE